MLLCGCVFVWPGCAPAVLALRCAARTPLCPAPPPPCCPPSATQMSSLVRASCIVACVAPIAAGFDQDQPSSLASTVTISITRTTYIDIYPTMRSLYCERVEPSPWRHELDQLNGLPTTKQGRARIQFSADVRALRRVRREACRCYGPDIKQEIKPLRLGLRQGTEVRCSVERRFRSQPQPGKVEL